MTSISPKPATVLYSAAHLAVDFCCAAAMFGAARAGGGALVLFVYNFFAFAMQLPLGVLADRLGRGPAFAALGCALVGMSGPLSGWPLLMAVLAGLGNGAFHIGAGTEVLRFSRGKASLLGIFVSPGAIGIFLGSAYPNLPHFPLWGGGLMLLFAAAILLGMGPGCGGAPLSVPAVGAPLLPLLLVVCIRSYCGAILSFPWREGAWACAALGALVLGKALGGIAADRFGPRRASLVSLGLCAPLFLLGGSPLAGLCAILLFNMTMPITLWGAAALLKECRGLAFGMLTFGLFIGLCPAYLGFDWAGGWTYALLSLASLVLLHLALPKEAT